MPLSSVRNIGHRGCVYEEPENTLPGFSYCSEVGADAVEFDVFELKSGEVVCYHGGGSDEIPGDMGDSHSMPSVSIMSLSFEHLNTIPFNLQAEEYLTESLAAVKEDKLSRAVVPLLRDVLTFCKRKSLGVKLELKGEHTEISAVLIVEELGMVDEVQFSSFNHPRLANLRRLHPERLQDGSHRYKTGALFNSNTPFDFLDRAKEIGASEIHLKYNECTKARVESAHTQGYRVMAWFCGPITMKQNATMNNEGNEDEAMYEKVIASGCDEMCVNRVYLLAEMKRKANK